MTQVTFEPEPAGIQQVMTSPEAAAALDKIDAALAEAVRASAPEMAGIGASYVEGILPQPAEVEGDELAGYVTTDSPIWHWIEYGSALGFYSTPFAPFRRGCGMLGLDFEEGGGGD